MVGRYEKMKMIEFEIEENIIDMDNITDLLCLPKYADSAILTSRFEELYEETLKLQEEYFKLKSQISTLEKIGNIIFE